METVSSAAPAPTAATAATPGAPASAAAAAPAAPLSAAQKALALQKSIAERLAAAKAKVPKLAAATSAAGTGVKLEAGGGAAAAAAASPAAPFHPSPSVIVKDESKSWMPLRLDALGRQVDEQGRVVQMDRPTELKVNQKAREEAAATHKTMPHAKIATTIIKEEGMAKFHGPMPNPTAPAPARARRMPCSAHDTNGVTLDLESLTRDFVFALPAFPFRACRVGVAVQIRACATRSPRSARRAAWCWFARANTSSRLRPCA